MYVYFTPIAQERLDSIVDYLDQIWGYQIREEFLSELDRCITLISEDPDLFPLLDGFADVRRCVLSFYNTLFYRVKDNQIQVLTVWDNRMNPATLNCIISQSR